MSNAPQRLSKVIKELNISLQRAVEFLASKGISVESNPNVKVDHDTYILLTNQFQQDMDRKEKAEQVVLQKKEEKEILKAERESAAQQKEEKAASQVIRAKAEAPTPVTIGKIDLNQPKKETPKAVETPMPAEPPKVEEKAIIDVPKSEPIEVQEPTQVPQEKQAEPEVNQPEPVVENAPEPVQAIDPIEEKWEKKPQEVTQNTQEQGPSSGPRILGKVDLESLAPKKPKRTAAQLKADTRAEQDKKRAEQKAKLEQENKAAEQIKEDAKQANLVETPKAEDPVSRNIETKYEKLEGPRFTGAKIDLTQFNKPKKKPEVKPQDKAKPATGQQQQGQGAARPAGESAADRKKRKRIRKDAPAPNNTQQPQQNGGANNNQQRGGGNRPNNNNNNNKGRGPAPKAADPKELTDAEISKQIKDTLEKLTGSKKSKGAKIRKAKREERREQSMMQEMEAQEQSTVLKVTEFVTVGEVATMMNVPVTQVISTCMSLGLMVTMNQRLDAETLTIVADEFGYKVEFVGAEVEAEIEQEEDNEVDLIHRPPIVTVMGHVDHGKTSLLDFIRKENVIAGESGGITQHIGAYSVELPSGQHITFLDTPGHEAFTAMRARGAQVTDIAIIVVSADDSIMPQTKEAIAHAQAANVPIVFAINKIDKPNANPEKIKEQLAGMNLLVEDWGGKIQSHDISAKMGMGVTELLEKVLLEAELLDLKANPKRNAHGTVIEAMLDKGRGYVSTILVETGTLNVGDIILAGQYTGRVRAMLDERGKPVKKAGPSTPVALLGLDGAPMAGDKFRVMNDEREARSIAAKRQQLQREQSVRTTKNITLEEIGRRLALGDFKELNIILKCDVDGSVEALSDALQRLSTDQVSVKIIHKGVGQITESDVLLAAASDAIIVGFQVRPAATARKIAERESVDIRTYSIIYDAINEIKDAMEGMLSPDTKEEIVCNVEIRETFKISKVGTIAGCMVLDGTVKRSTNIRIIRDGVVVHTGELASLKRFKDDVKEVSKGYECGLNIKNFNDIKEGDIIEGFQQVEIKRKL